MCSLCGLEVCSECFAAIPQFHVSCDRKKTSKKRADITPKEAVTTKNLRCQAQETHCQVHFLPISRFTLDELERVIAEMEAAAQLLSPVQLSEKEIFLLTPQFDASATASTSIAVGPRKHSDVDSSSRGPRSTLLISHHSTSVFHPPDDPARIPQHPFQTFADTDLTEAMFRSKWSKGETMVVTGLLKKFSHDWSPEYFIKTYGKEECEIMDCDTQRVKVIKVGDFFQMFGDYSARRKILKLKVERFVTVCISCPEIVSFLL
jgi:lysine-specific demethylase 3